MFSFKYIRLNCLVDKRLMFPWLTNLETQEEKNFARGSPRLFQHCPECLCRSSWALWYCPEGPFHHLGRTLSLSFSPRLPFSVPRLIFFKLQNSPCLHVAMSPWLHDSMSPCLHVSMSPRLHVSMSPCSHVSMSPKYSSSSISFETLCCFSPGIPRNLHTKFRGFPWK